MNELIITQPDELRRIITDAVNKAVSGLSPSKERTEKQVLTNREAMRFLSVSRSTLQRWRNEGRLPYRQVQGKILYTKDDIQNFLEENQK